MHPKLRRERKACAALLSPAPPRTSSQPTRRRVLLRRPEFLLTSGELSNLLLWRASVSKHPFFGRVSLGPLELIARNTLMNPEGEIPQVFAALLSRWTCTDENRSIAQAVMCPFRERWQGVNAYRMYLGEVVAYVKVDSQPFTPQLRAHALPTSPVLTLIIRNLGDSKDLKSMIRTVRRSDANVKLMRAKIARSRSARAKNAP